MRLASGPSDGTIYGDRVLPHFWGVVPKAHATHTQCGTLFVQKGRRGETNFAGFLDTTFRERTNGRFSSFWHSSRVRPQNEKHFAQMFVASEAPFLSKFTGNTFDRDLSSSSCRFPPYVKGISTKQPLPSLPRSSRQKVCPRPSISPLTGPLYIFIHLNTLQPSNPYP